MPGLRKSYDRFDVIGKNKLFVKLTIEDKIKLMFGMLSGDPFQAFVRKPTNPFKPPFNKQSCIYSYFQNVLFLQI